MAAKRSETRQHWPVGLRMPRDGYYAYESPISKKVVSIGRVSEAQAISIAKNASQEIGKAKNAAAKTKFQNVHDEKDDRGLLTQEAIASKAMLFDRVVGVYFLLNDDEIVYVGQSKSVLTRLASHHLNPSKDFNRVFVVECPEGHLNRVERLYINKFKPRYNNAVPNVPEGQSLWTATVRDVLKGAIARA